MRIAHLIVAHTDPVFVKRLVKRLSSFSDVYIHIDKKAQLEDFLVDTHAIPNCYYTNNRFVVFWGGMSVVYAELELLREAKSHQTYDRYILLHGADYPLKTDVEITNFFNKNLDVEFIRSCCISNSKEFYFADKCKRIWFMDTKCSVIKRLLSLIPLRIRSGYVYFGLQKYNVYWGSALWCLTDACVEYVLEHSKNNRFNNWFKFAFAPDELYFHTIIMNSEFANRTIYGGPEPRKTGLVNWRNLHYFEYPKQIRIWERNDYTYLKTRKELYFRKVSSYKSSGLLDILDYVNSIEKQNK